MNTLHFAFWIIFEDLQILNVRILRFTQFYNFVLQAGFDNPIIFENLYVHNFELYLDDFCRSKKDFTQFHIIVLQA